MSKKLSVEEAVRLLDSIDTENKGPEANHIDADNILMAASDPRVRDAYKRVIERAHDWWYA